MKTKKSILFIINPQAGNKKKLNIAGIIESVIGNSFEYKILYWEYPEQDFNKLIEENSDEKTSIIASIGGDGTVNRIASQLINSDKTLAIIPIGSGNGIARHLGISMNPEMAIELIKTGKTISIDAGKINDNYFFTTAGVGFDAHISHLFAKTKIRGFYGYLWHSIIEFFKYKSKQYTILIDNNSFTKKVFLITFANANQYGNNAKIAPMADVKDGKIDVVFLQKPNFLRALFVLVRLFKGQIHKSTITSSFQVDNLKIIDDKGLKAHYDGENLEIQKWLEISIVPRAIKVIVPQNFN